MMHREAAGCPTIGERRHVQVVIGASGATWGHLAAAGERESGDFGLGVGGVCVCALTKQPLICALLSWVGDMNPIELALVRSMEL